MSEHEQAYDCDIEDPPQVSGFEKLEDTQWLIKNLLSVSLTEEPTPQEENAEAERLLALHNILSYYQEQCYLLDPHLEQLVSPIATAFREHARAFASGATSYSAVRVKRLAWMLYYFVKFRGYKTIVRYFPHEVADLDVAISYVRLNDLAQGHQNWHIRYLSFLWLSLICMLPFDLSRFDASEVGLTARMLEELGKADLGKPGLTREGASLMLSRLYMRKDTLELLSEFLASLSELSRTESDLFTTIGSMTVLAEITKSAPDEVIQQTSSAIRNVLENIAASPILAFNPIIRKQRSKCIARSACRMLPSTFVSQRRFGKVFAVISSENPRNSDGYETEDMSVPDEVEESLGQLFELLVDKDTSVRWSAAKGISRIAHRLPMDYVEQILDNLLEFYATYGASTLPTELPVTAELPWHGTTLAFAELARRNLIPPHRLRDVMNWMSKALFFDVRKGAASIGSNVRDASAYVIWSLARTEDKEAMGPFATELAQNLVRVSLFDREIHIRRAASAAFQENVGRMGLFPHGIDVLAKTDFYSISIRRSAFLKAAREVGRHPVYLSALLDHLLQTVLRHWDEALRRLGAEALRGICELDLVQLGPQVINTLEERVMSMESSEVHGALLAMSQLAAAFMSLQEGIGKVQRKRILRSLERVSSTSILSTRNHLIPAASCIVIQNTISSLDLCELELHDLGVWKKVLDNGLRHRHVDVQSAAASAMRALSQFRDCSPDEMKRSSPILQQSLARLLGSLDYLAFDNGLDVAIPCLFQVLDPKHADYFRDVESRRNAYTSLAEILVTVSSRISSYISPQNASHVYDLLLAGLDDYTVNERGDVGSWVRMACANAFHGIISSLVKKSSLDYLSPETLHQYLPYNIFHAAVGNILRQGVERLDNVRQCCGELFTTLLSLQCPEEQTGTWEVEERGFFKELLGEERGKRWADGAWLYPRATRFLDVKRYRHPVLRGILMSVGSKTSSTQMSVLSSISMYARELQERDGNIETLLKPYSFNQLIEDLLSSAFEDTKANTFIIPIMHTLNALLDDDLFHGTVEEGESSHLDLMLTLATKQVERIKNVQRLEESMKLTVNLLAVHDTAVKLSAVRSIGPFLAHQYPTIRSSTAEALYLALQIKDIDYDEAVEQILLETEWSALRPDELAESVSQVLRALGHQSDTNA